MKLVGFTIWLNPDLVDMDDIQMRKISLTALQLSI